MSVEKGVGLIAAMRQRRLSRRRADPPGEVLKLPAPPGPVDPEVRAGRLKGCRPCSWPSAATTDLAS